ncbi:Two component transcriptional regulator, LuxR family [Verrucomicrobia bacterium]|nr:Two component transcriptional regulator, LuxR family [Verrucomicrobiota bacterium]
MATCADRKQRVFLVDDHALVREWLTSLINQQDDLEVCGEAETAAAALTAIGASNPDVAIVDISLKDHSGIDLIKGLQDSHPTVPVLVLSMHEETHFVERVLHAGAKGYIMKREATKKVVEGVRQVAKGELYLSEAVTQALATRFVEGRTPVEHPVIEQLSDRELEVFELLGQAQDPQQIAKKLQINAKTVHTYCARIREKMKLSSSLELFREAIHWHERG